MRNITEVIPDRTLLTVCEKHGFAECYVTLWLWRTIPFVLLIIGTIGNFLSLLVLARPRMRKYSTTVFLLFLAVCDTIVLWTALFRMTLLRLFDIDVRNWSEFHCSFMQWVSLTCAGVSIWILVIMTSERIYRVKRPNHARTVCVPKTALKVTLVALAVCAVFCGHLLFGFRIQDHQINTESRNGSEKDEIIEICDHTSVTYTNFYKGPWAIMVALIANILPMVLIIIGNSVIAITIKIQSRRMGQIMSEKERAAVKLLFVLCIFFVLATTPYNIYRLVSYKVKNETMSDIDYVKLKLASVIVHCLMWSNFAFNFVLYFMSGTLFKNEWKMFVGDVLKRLKLTHLFDDDIQKDEIHTTTDSRTNNNDISVTNVTMTTDCDATLETKA